MGWDLSYHPITEKQMFKWYFDLLEEPGKLEPLIEEYQLDENLNRNAQKILMAGNGVAEDDLFDKTHGFFLANMSGIFQDYYYLRGAALSFIELPQMHEYYKPWQDIVPDHLLTQDVHNKISENYCSGVYIPADKISAFIQAYKTDTEIQQVIDQHFSMGRLAVFMKALEFAEKQNTGLLEATDVIVPNPFDLEETQSYADLEKCYPQGVLLYQQAAEEQLRQAQQSKPPPEETQAPKRSFWQRLFGN